MMKYVSYPATAALSCVLLLWGCAGGSADKGDAAAKPRPPETNPAQTQTQQKPPPLQQPQRPPPDPASEGMTAYELQERLTRLGYKPGAVDGIAGARTIEALKKYQADNKLPATGIMDVETIRKLRSEK
jgi:peptidoglycan hydrolase-like protein with peptidoglycan-binding domain